MAEKPRVALLGLGIMGSGMAGRLLSSGFPLTVYNRNREKARPFAEEGAFVASTPREAASRAGIVLSMVADDVASREMWLGEEGALAGAARGAVLIESSTLTVEWIKELADAALRHHCELLDAPVTGTKPHAASGELTFLAGGTEPALAKARPVLSALGKDILHLGPNGSGALMKLINNFLCGVQAASFAEAAAMVHAGGLNQQEAFSLLTAGAPGSGLIKRVAARVSTDDPSPNFLLRWMAKDLGYAIDTASQEGIKLQTAAPALAIFKTAIAEGHGDEDFSCVIKSSFVTSRHG